VDNKTVLITGAAKRIGASIAKQLHQVGMNIIIHHNTSEKEADELANELNSSRTDSAMTLQANLTESGSYETLIKNAVQFKNRLDVLVNNASVFYPTDINHISEQQWNETINTNLKAPLFLSHYAATHLKKHNGCIINITDIHGEKPLKDHPIYCISKSGLITLTQSLAKELGPNIRVNAISPGAITWPDNMNKETQEEILQHTALEKVGTMEDISKTALFLINDADYISGQILNVDGGRSLY
jgi:pteridine reductase